MLCHQGLPGTVVPGLGAGAAPRCVPRSHSSGPLGSAASARLPAPGCPGHSSARIGCCCAGSEGQASTQLKAILSPRLPCGQQLFPLQPSRAQCRAGGGWVGLDATAEAEAQWGWAQGLLCRWAGWESVTRTLEQNCLQECLCERQERLLLVQDGSHKGEMHLASMVPSQASGPWQRREGASMGGCSAGAPAFAACCALWPCWCCSSTQHLSLLSLT